MLLVSRKIMAHPWFAPLLHCAILPPPLRHLLGQTPPAANTTSSGASASTSLLDWKAMLLKHSSLMSSTSSLNLSFLRPVENTFCFLEEEVLDGGKDWDLVLVSYSKGKRPFYGYLLDAVKRKCDENIGPISEGQIKIPVGLITKSQTRSFKEDLNHLFQKTMQLGALKYIWEAESKFVTLIKVDQGDAGDIWEDYQNFVWNVSSNLTIVETSAPSYDSGVGDDHHRPVQWLDRQEDDQIVQDNRLYPMASGRGTMAHRPL